MTTTDWLPPLITLDRCGGEWDMWNRVLYAAYVEDFLKGPVMWRGFRVSTRRHPETDGKSATFWHLTTAEEEGHGRLPDVRRAERIRWAKVLITAPEDKVRTWVQPDRSELSLGIAVPDFSYVVFLTPLSDRVHLKTAYYVEQLSTQKRYEGQWQKGHDFTLPLVP